MDDLDIGLQAVRSGTRHEATGLINANDLVLGLSAPESTSRASSARINVGPTNGEYERPVRGEGAFGGSAA
jgi:hypothetical protein